MSYTINLTNGAVFATIPDGTINTASSMTLVGKNYAGYGQFLDDNFIRLLENGANSIPPTAPLTGQVYFNTTTKLLNVYNGTGWKSISGSQASSSAPTNNATGDLWYDTVNQQLNVWTGTQWLLVGPIYNGSQGVTGAIPATIIDNASNSHTVIELYVGNSIVGFISKDSAFTPQTPISGFTTIRPGITLSTLVGTQVPLFQGTATNSQALSGLIVSQFLRSDTNSTTTGTLSVSNNTGLNVGAANDLNIGVVGSAVNFTNNDVNGNINFRANIAERFASDAIYEAGTVVELGGAAEITKSTVELSESVFGVISSKAAYLMNNAAGDDLTHPPVAMTGRVPVKVTGIVNKGDRLVSAGAGMARAAQQGEATAFNVIGRALVSKLDSGVGTVEAIVTIK
jgi:hypothetical protein